MKKEILIAFICASLILITPFTVVAQENKVSSNLTDEPDVEGLVAQIRGVVNEILQKYEHIPIVANLRNFILNTLDSFGLILYCIALYILTIPFAILFLFFGLVLKLEYIALYFVGIVGIILSELDRKCLFIFDLIQPLKSIYTLIKLNDISEINCPCLLN